jgi:transcription initiation factor TFIIIB Brf1 subunit/transcription initiation factor TFIIB
MTALKCPECGSTNYYYTKKDNSLNCRKCGCQWEKMTSQVIKK